jgi:RHS repeat-associated protein
MVKPPLRTKSIGFKVSEEEYAPGATSPFTYDQYDNLTKAGSMAWSPGYDPNTNHYQLAGTSYDLSGNVMNGGSNSYTWDPFNKMSSVSSTACGSSGCTATYDAFGRMVEFSKNSNYKENWYTQAGVAVMSGTTLTESYLGAPGGGTFMEVGTGGQNDYLHKDWLGNVRIASLIGNQTVGADLAYAPYGEVYNFISGSNIDTMFTGDLTQLDAGVLFDTPNRELAASNQGRWLSPDPAGAGWNQYGYMTNPLNSIDPSGLACYPLEKLIFNNCAAFMDEGVGFGAEWDEFDIMNIPIIAQVGYTSAKTIDPSTGQIVGQSYTPIYAQVGTGFDIQNNGSFWTYLAANNGWSFLGQNSTWWKTFLKEAVQPWKDQCANVFANAFANGGIVNAVSENLEGGPDPDEVIKQAGSMAAAQYVVNNGLVCPGCSSTYRAIVSGTETAATSFVLADAYTRIGQGAYAEISSYLAGQCR